MLAVVPIATELADPGGPVELGDRQYDVVLGGFLEVDPVEGGSANDYDYAEGDPVNDFDLDGTYAGPKPVSGVVNHEAVHVRQFAQGSLVFAGLYAWKAIRNGTGCGNNYERSAYNSAGPQSC